MRGGDFVELHNGSVSPALAGARPDHRRPCGGSVIEAAADGAELACLFVAGPRRRRPPRRARALLLVAVLSDPRTGDAARGRVSLFPDRGLPSPPTARRHTCSSGRSPSSTTSSREGHPWLKPVRFQPPDERGTGRAERRRASARGRSSAWRARRSTRSPSAPSTRESSSRGTSVSSATGKRCCTWRSRWATSTAAWRASWPAGPTSAPSISRRPSPGTPPSGTPPRTARRWRRWAACRRPPRAQAIRAIALELERVANHVGDLGALAGDVGFLPTSSWCGRVRGDVLNVTALICGNRFGRGLVRPGGVGFDLDERTGRRCWPTGVRSCARDCAGRHRPAVEDSLGARPLRGHGHRRRAIRRGPSG